MTFAIDLLGDIVGWLFTLLMVIAAISVVSFIFLQVFQFLKAVVGSGNGNNQMHPPPGE